MFNEIFLGKEVFVVNEFGEKTKSLVYSNTSLFFEEKSVKASEFYQAMQTGLKVEKVIRMNVYEYFDYMQDAIKKVCKAKHPITNKMIEYTIIREYETNDDSIELTLVRGVENGNA